MTSAQSSGKTAAAASDIQVGLDSPGTGQKIYDENILVSGWLFAANRDPASCRVRAYLDGRRVAETTLLSNRPEVCDRLNLSREINTGFRMFGRIEPARTEPRDAVIEITASWEGVAEQKFAERAIRLVPALLHERPYGEVVHPQNEVLLHRENIYGSGPPLENPGIEVINLLREYLPSGASVLDVGCGAGAYGPDLMAAGHNWLGLETNAHCCDILQRRQLPFRRVDPDSCGLPCADAEWDCAICIEVLEHVKEPEIFVREIARVIRGRALFSVPNLEVIPYLHEWGVVPWHLLEGDHKNFFTRASLGTLLGKSFRRIEIFPYGEHPLRTRDDVAVHLHLWAIADV